MKLYKFLSLEPFERVADALLGRHLYCALPSELNDPLEGMLGYESTLPGGGRLDDPATFAEIAQTDKELARARVCCFSARADSMQMWSYYTRGHKGICLEVDMSDHAEHLVEVKYVAPAELQGKPIVDRLRYKHTSWQHEDEYRYIRIDTIQGEFVHVKIESVLMAAGIDQRFMLPVFELCRHLGIKRELASFSTKGELVRLPFGDAPFLERLAPPEE